MLARVNDDKADQGGIMLGGISFGVGAPKPTAASPASSARAERSATATEPVELGDVLLPLRVVALGSFLPRGEHRGGANAPLHPLRVEGGDVDSLFARLAPRILLEVPSVLLEGRRARVELAVAGIKSLRPDELVVEVPLLRSLLDGRRLLERLREGALSVEVASSELARLWDASPLVARVLGHVETVRVGAQAARAAQPPSRDDAIDRILDLVGDGGGDDTAPLEHASARSGGSGSGGKFDTFLGAVAHSGKSGTSFRPDEAIRLVDEALSTQLTAILQHPEVRRLESAWRGLAFVARRMPKRGVLFEVLSCEDDAIPSELDRLAQDRSGGAPPISFAIVDAAVTSDASSLAWLRALADVAEAHTLPVLTNASPQLFGHKTLDAIDRLDNKTSLFDAPERAPWRAEAHRPATLWLSLALNRVLSRVAYDKRTSRVREAQVGELGSADAGVVWMQPAWAVASLAMKSFERHEWPCGVTGARDGGLVDDLPVREIDLGGETLALPTETFFSTETQAALGRIGLLALASAPNSDAAYLLSAATAYVPPPKRTYDTATSEPVPHIPQASLVDQLFVARLAQYLRALASRIGRDEREDDVRELMKAALWEHFRGAPPPGPELHVTVQGGEVSVTVRPRRHLGVKLEELTLSVPLA